MTRFPAPALRRFLPIVAATLGLAAVARAAVPTYSTFELQARSNFGDGFNLPPGSSFNSGSPALNDAGALAFRLIVVGSTGNAGLWWGGGGSGSVVYHAPVNWLLSDPSMSSAGRTAFEEKDIGISNGVLVYDPGTGGTTTEILPGGIFGIDSFGDPLLNDSDVIGFRGDQGATNAYFFDDGVSQTPVAFEGGGGVGFLFVPQFDDSNRFGAKVRLGGTSGSLPDEIRRYEPDGTFTVMAVDDDGDPLSPFTGFSNGVGMSPGGLVAFTAALVGGGDGVFVSDGVTTTEIATSADPEVSSIDFFRPVVNDGGVVAFRAFDAAGLRVVYAGDGTELRRIVGEHDLLPTDLGEARVDQHDSSPVFGGTVAINASGDVAFAATLTPPGNDQIEWGTGMFIAYADDVVAAPATGRSPPRLAAPRPNPFADRTRIEFAPRKAGTVRLVVHDVTGRRVRTLVNGARSAGPQAVDWNGRDDAGRRVAAGTYFLRLETSEGGESRRVALVPR